MPKTLNEGRMTLVAEIARSRKSQHSRMDQLVVEDHCSADMSSVERIDSQFADEEEQAEETKSFIN